MQTDTIPTVNPSVAIRSEQVAAQLADKSLLGASTAPYVLCLEMGKDKLRFCIKEPSTGAGQKIRCSWLEEYTFPTLLTDYPLLPALKSLQSEHPIWQGHDWKEVVVSVNTPSFTLIPSDLFRKEYAAHYLQLARGNALPVTEQTHTYAHTAEGFHSVFNLDIRLLDWLVAAFPLQQLTVVHQSSALLNIVRQRPAGELLLYFEDEFVTLGFRRADSLAFCNKFAYKNASDLMYFVLFVISELEQDPSQLPVVLYGEITPFAETYGLLSRFLSNLSFGTPAEGLALLPEFDELPEHRYGSMFGLLSLGAHAA